MSCFVSHENGGLGASERALVASVRLLAGVNSLMYLQSPTIGIKFVASGTDNSFSTKVNFFVNIKPREIVKNGFTLLTGKRFFLRGMRFLSVAPQRARVVRLKKAIGTGKIFRFSVNSFMIV